MKAPSSVAFISRSLADDDARDGLPAELARAQRLDDSAPSYYSMTAPTPDEARFSAAVVHALTSGWQSKFALRAESDASESGGVGGSGEGRGDDEALASQLTLAFVHAATCAIVFELAGRSALAPALALTLAAADVYVLRPDTEQSRVTLSLSDLPAP